jgi:DNA repair exonuclease SbcCD ATPase subunit
MNSLYLILTILISSLIVLICLAWAFWLRYKLKLAGQRFISLDSELNELQNKVTESEKTIPELETLNKELKSKISQLEDALNAGSFDGRFPICSNCKDIRDETGSWRPIEDYIAALSTDADFSHSLCPTCAKKLYPDMFEDGKKMHTLTWK